MGKRWFATGILLIISWYTFAAVPPTAALKAFDVKFKNATTVNWGKEGPKVWEAEFNFEGSRISANFAEDGTWLETERIIKTEELPPAVLKAIKANFPDWKIIEADKTETLKHGLIYEANLKKGLSKKDVAFKEDGTPVSE